MGAPSAPVAAALATLLAAGISLAIAGVGASESPPLRDIPAKDEGDPGNVVASFYATYREEAPAGGLPPASLEPRLSERLAGLVRAARAEQERFMKKSPDEKPPWIEGDLFSSRFEGATTTAGGAVEIGRDGASARVAMKLAFATEGAMPVSWQDDYLLVKEDGTWRIDDVEYHGSWDFAPRGKLSASLTSTP